MSRTTIEWTEYSWNPMRGCSPTMRCARTCWAVRMANRQRGNPKYVGFTRIGEHGPEWTGKVALIEEELHRPLHWKTPRIVAVGLMGDWMRLLDEEIDKILAVEALCPQHLFMHLTKLPRKMAGYCASVNSAERFHDINVAAQAVMGSPGYGAVLPTQRDGMVPGGWPLPNLMPGVSILDQADADAAREPMRELAATGWNTWVSHEPAWGGIDWKGWEFLQYMVSGGQTGPGARPSHPEWFRADRDFCAEHEIPWMFKAWGSWRERKPGDPNDGRMIRLTRVGRNGQDLANATDGGDVWMQRFEKRAAGRLLDGREHLAMPEKSSVPREN